MRPGQDGPDRCFRPPRRRQSRLPVLCSHRWPTCHSSAAMERKRAKVSFWVTVRIAQVFWMAGIGCVALHCPFAYPSKSVQGLTWRSRLPTGTPLICPCESEESINVSNSAEQIRRTLYLPAFHHRREDLQSTGEISTHFVLST
jgi:hypothetical protein